MAKLKIGVCRLCVSGSHRAEIGSWLVEIASVSLTDPEVKRHIEDVVHYPVAQTPAPVARNKAVAAAFKNECDILFMVDDDAAPAEGFFKRAFQFLKTHQGPAIIGSPYCCGGQQEKVQVFDFLSPNNDPQKGFALTQIPREDAARREGIQRVANVGTHCIAYRLDAFGAIKKPYFSYSFDEYQEKVLDTEEIYCHRAMYFAGVKIYCDWDSWAPHYKLRRIEKPWIVTKEDIDQRYMEEARAELLLDK